MIVLYFVFSSVDGFDYLGASLLDNCFGLIGLLLIVSLLFAGIWLTLVVFGLDGVWIDAVLVVAGLWVSIALYLIGLSGRCCT